MIRVGLDVTSTADWRHRLVRTPGLAAAAFTSRELYHTSARPDLLARIWAVKEAAAKLTGQGFEGVGWHGYDVRLGPHIVEVRLPAALVPCGIGQAAIRLLASVTKQDGHVVAALLATSATVDPVAAVQLLPLAPAARRNRYLLRSATARAAGCLAACRLVPGSSAVQYTQTAASAPQLRLGRRLLAVSLSHSSELAAALVATPASGTGPVARPASRSAVRLEEYRGSVKLIFSVQDSLFPVDQA